MYFLYSILLTVGFIVLLPRFVLDALRHGKYVAGLGERLGKVPALADDGSPVIWLHCVSVGETQAARSLFTELRRRFPQHRLVVSTTTLTGQRVAREVFKDEAALVFYFPYDWRWTVRRTLRAIKPAAVLIMETELWPGFLRECRRRGIQTAMVNGRLSENSFRRYRLIRRFIKRVVNDLDLALMQAADDASRIRALGLAPSRVKVTGNIKFDASVAANEQSLTAELRARFNFGAGRPLIVAASTHAPEERIVIEAFQETRADSHAHAPRLLIAPRHPERFAETAALLNYSGLKWARRSDAPHESDAVCDVILLDSIGELRAVYPLAEIVFVGGSIAPVGGHNVLEPAASGKCIITGAHTRNFAAIMRVFREADALIELPPVGEADAVGMLSTAFKELLWNKDRRALLAAHARQLIEQNRGATQRTVELLEELLTDISRKGAKTQRKNAGQ